ncbi:methylated-DNA--[protein]-cysteine S-methyltransferase [Cryptosporangium arvum]|uniref:methylated-DNA--[protein]-cysteine S-methyltransferase n=1 Tax=Cryptosporangium arvum TaxID=80871 RepID=UPI0007C47EDA|nr:methylated-DNA--[protein]-cysteine S-methyltransferase [Cryptosporangium arvum]
MTGEPRVEPETCAAVELTTPIGPLGVLVTPRGVLAVGLAGLAAAEEAAAGLPGLTEGPLPGPVERVRGEFDAYFAGRLRRFTVPIDWRLSSGYAREVREALYAGVGYGETISYGALARRVGDADVEGEFGAARAVGRAMATNPVPVIVPCHRVLAADGSLHGFGGGLEMKRRLLALEGAVPDVLF